MFTINSLTWFLAFLPIIIILVLMMGFKWGGSRAGTLTWIITQPIALLFFGATFEILQFAYVKAFFLSIDVLLIIWGAMFLYQITKKAGTIQIIGKFLAELTDSRAFIAIFLGWLFPSFLQGMGGFGVPVAVAAPLLVSAGFSPTLSVLLTSIGHGWGVTFGSMGSSFRTMMAVTGLSDQYLAPFAAILLGIAAIFCGIYVIYLSGNKKDFQKALPLTLISGIILSIGQYYLSTNGLWLIAVTVPSLVCLVVAFVYVRFFSMYSKRYLLKRNNKERRQLTNALVPYIILVLLIVIFNFLSPLKELLGPFQVSVRFPELITKFGFITPAETSKKIEIFIHPGIIITTSGLISFVYLKAKGYFKGNELREITADTIKSSLNTSIAIFSLVGTAVVMNHAQMTSVLANGLSNLISKDFYPLISPFIGALGAFITGSNSNSNVLFGALQFQTAELLNLPVALILAAQTAGGALGSIMAPAKVILGCSTVGLAGEEGKVIGKLILYCVSLVLIIGIFTLIFSGTRL